MDEHKRRYYSIGEVSGMLGLKPHILRFWESEFPMLRPRKNRAGNRAFTERDIKIVRLIMRLLYEEKFTIEGARQRIRTDRDLVEDQLSLPLDTPVAPAVKERPLPDAAALGKMRKEISEIIAEIEAL
jgi:DNA-binding transcriptional MerR regulator